MSRATEPQQAASLTSRLLARRGGAQPAMRRQMPDALASVTPSLEDLGWNDMGEEAQSAEPVAEQPVPVRITPSRHSSIAQQIAAISERMAQGRAEALPEQKDEPKSDQPDHIAPVAKTPRIKTGVKQAAKPARATRKAAFTLRLDPERHLRLRLLSAFSHRSAQQLVVEALDHLIAGQDQLEHLARQVEAGRTGTRNSIGD